MEGRGQESGAVPVSAMEAVTRTSVNISEFKSQFVQFLSLCDHEVLGELPPLERAKSLILLAKATTALFTLRLRCNGVHPDDHAVKSEIERLRLYQHKLERFVDLSKAPVRRSTTLNYQAATRFIEHSLPDLSPDQRQSMRDISKVVGPKIKYLERSVHKKRKQQCVQTATQQFREKAARELLGDNKCDFKGPLHPEASHEHDTSSD